VEAYRRLTERETETGTGSRNQIEQLQHLLQEEQERSKKLELDLEQTKKAADENTQALERTYQGEVEQLNKELADVRELLLKNAPTSESKSSEDSDNLGPASRDRIENNQMVLNDLKLARLSIKGIERKLERETRRADRAEAESQEIRDVLENLQREQQVKDSQLDAIRCNLQSVLSEPTAAQAVPVSSDTHESKERHISEEEEEEDFGNVLASELASMRESYESKLEELQTRLSSVEKENKELMEEIKSLRI